MRNEINKDIEAVSKVADPLKILASADTMKVLGVQRPLLQVSNTLHMHALRLYRTSIQLVRHWACDFISRDWARHASFVQFLQSRLRILDGNSLRLLFSVSCPHVSS